MSTELSQWRPTSSHSATRSYRAQRVKSSAEQRSDDFLRHNALSFVYSMMIVATLAYLVWRM
ncbi:MAG: hypothetical protein JWM11_7758 [Planctomycetaceae bacterium]|nr:hypothetical protein [Planctomycetaceae bacterium]